MADDRFDLRRKDDFYSLARIYYRLRGARDALRPTDDAFEAAHTVLQPVFRDFDQACLHHYGMGGHEVDARVDAFVRAGNEFQVGRELDEIARQPALVTFESGGPRVGLQAVDSNAAGVYVTPPSPAGQERQLAAQMASHRNHRAGTGGGSDATRLSPTYRPSNPATRGSTPGR